MAVFQPVFRTSGQGPHLLYTLDGTAYHQPAYTNTRHKPCSDCIKTKMVTQPLTYSTPAQQPSKQAAKAAVCACSNGRSSPDQTIDTSVSKPYDTLYTLYTL